MSTGIIVGIVVAVIVIGAVVFGMMAVSRRRRLQQRFGPEYDRVVGERDAFGPRPLLRPHQVAWLGVEPQMATQWEREQADRLGLQVTTSQALAADPAGTALAALSRLPPGPLAVHVDVDVLDFTDAPLAENTDGRNMGPTLDQITKALIPAARDQRMRTLSVGELNPTRCAGDPAALARFVTSIARILAATIH